MESDSRLMLVDDDATAQGQTKLGPSGYSALMHGKGQQQASWRETHRFRPLMLLVTALLSLALLCGSLLLRWHGGLPDFTALHFEGFSSLAWATRASHGKEAKERSGRMVLLRWAKHPEFCLATLGSPGRSAASVHLWSCDAKSHAQAVLLPTGTDGQIHAGAAPDFCLVFTRHGQLLWLECTGFAAEKQSNYSLAHEHGGHIRLASTPERCIRVPFNKRQNGVWLMHGPCDTFPASDALSSQWNLESLDCEFGDWSDWSPSAGVAGELVRARPIAVEAQGLGRPCEGDALQTKTSWNWHIWPR